MIERLRDAARKFVFGSEADLSNTEGAGFMTVKPDQNLGSSEEEYKTVDLKMQIAALEKKLSEAQLDPDYVDGQQIQLIQNQLENLRQAKKGTWN